MKKRTVLAILTALIITAGIFVGCGNQADGVPAGNMTNETGSALEEDESLKDNAAEEKQADSDQKDTKTPSAEKTTDEKEAEAKPESKDTAPAEAPEKPADNGTKSDENNNAGNTQAKPEGNTGSKPSGGNSSSGNGNSGSDSAGGSGNSGSDSAGGSAPAAQPEAPAHEHVWHEHTATRQEWVPNVVVVDDYQTQQVVAGFYFECNCGATFQPNDPAFEEHGMAHILAGEDDGHWTVDVYEEQQVKVGSHEEDHGHYETVTYVDYYYCDCGATK